MTDPTPSIIKGGYIVLSADGMQTRHIPVSSADEASTIWRAFVEDNGLGASDLKRDSGFIYSNDRKLVAKVSYNGRVWTPDGELLQERPTLNMTGPKTITASLEGMRVIIGERCELQEYNFSVNRWFPKDEAAWPLSRPRANEWLAGWNDVDRFAAVNLLTAQDQYPDPPSPRSIRNLPGQPQPK